MEFLKILRLMGFVCVLGGNGEKVVKEAGKYGVEVGSGLFDSFGVRFS